MKTQRIAFVVLAVAALVVGYYVYQIFRAKAPVHQPVGQTDSLNAPEQTKQLVRQERLNLHRACRFADSVGIDTSRYRVAGDDVAMLNRNLTAVLNEIRYGKKPSRLAFSGLREAMDPMWATKLTGALTPSVLAQQVDFEPYRQLVEHYAKLRPMAKVHPALADSLRLIRQTLNFYRYVNRFDADKLVIVNIPAAELTVFDRKGARLLPMPVIVGRADKQTPCMTTYIKDIITYPYWNVPRDIALSEMLPRMQRNVAYIYNQNLQVLDEQEHEIDPDEVDWDGVSTTNFPYRIRQGTGCDNSLGLMKFDLENPLAIYLHDTNSRDLFRFADRWRSHGCVRVQKPVDLANLVLGRDQFDEGFMNRCLDNQKPKTLPIPKRVPVFITYNTADVDSTGSLRFYRDVYALDK